jgi:cell division protein FtsB
MPTAEARIERLERRVETLEAKFNDLMEGMAGQWAYLSKRVQDALGKTARTGQQHPPPPPPNTG